MTKFKKWWAELPPSRKEQVYAAIGFLIIGGFCLFFLSELIRKLKPILPILIFIPLFFWDSISAFIQRQRNWVREQAKQQAVQMDAIYKEVASSVVLPVIPIIWNIKLDVDSLYYFGTPAYGDGFYYQLPSACESKSAALNLQRKVERRLSTYLECTFADVAKKKMVSVYGDILVIRFS